MDERSQRRDGSRRPMGPRTFLADLGRQREIIRVLAWRQIRARYAATWAGGLWEALHPLILILVYDLVFTLGFKAQGPDGLPYLLYFITGMVPWMMLADVLSQSSTSIVQQANLVKKTTFPTEILPLIHLLSASLSHVILLGITLLVLWFHGHPPSLYLLQLPYAYLSLCVLLAGLFWMISSLTVFFRDLGQIVTALINIWFWTTPVVWIPDMVPPSLRWLLEFNPAYHIVQGYRNALLFHEPVWIDPWGIVRFWSVAVVTVIFGAWIFKRLKPHFPDVI